MLRVLALLLVFALGSVPAHANPWADRVAEVNTRRDAGDDEGARAYADSLRVELLVADDLEAAAAMQDLGKVVVQAWAIDPIPLFRRALEIRERELGMAHQETLDSALALAQELIWEPEIEEATRILAAASAALEGEDPDDVRFLLLHSRLGSLADHHSNYAEARRHYQRSLELTIRHDGAKDRGVGVLLYRIARLDYIQGNNPSALEAYTRAVDLFREILAPDDPTTGFVLLDRAAVYSDMEQFDHSIADLESARALMEATLPPLHPNLGALYHRFGETEMRRDDLDAARPWLEKALALREEALGPDHPNVSATLSKMAQLHRRQGHPELAIPVLERRREIERRVYGEDHHWYAAVLYSLSLNHTDLGEFDLALDEALEAERIQRNQLRKDTREMAERTGLMYAADRTEGAGLKVALTLTTRDLSQEQLRRVWDAQIDARWFVLDELAYRRRALGRLDDGDVGRLWDALASASSELARVSAENPPPADARLVAAQKRHEDIQLQIAAIDNAFANPPRADRVTLAEVERNLPATAAMVSFSRYQSYFTYEFAYLALVRTPYGRIHAADLGAAAEIDSLVGRWREEARGAALDTDPVGAESAYREIASALRERVWDPIAGSLGGADLALIVPDGQLSLVNLAALPRDDGSYLVEGDLTLHVLGTERDVSGVGATAMSQGGLLALGAPDFDAAMTTASNGGGSVDGFVEVSSFRGARSGCGDFASTLFRGLPGSASEIDAVARHWTGGQATILTGADASEAVFKALAPQARVIHLATHGFFLTADCEVAAPDSRGVGGMAPTSEAPRTVAPDENPLSLSGLALAGANRRHDAPLDIEDGVVTAEEVAALDLGGVEWAVLSACDTGVGDVHLAEGVLGLRRAFRAAGARTLILSLWSVDDLATRDWMSELYAARFERSRSTADAVREAALSQLTRRREAGESTHPFFWGGFVATGDWR